MSMISKKGIYGLCAMYTLALNSKDTLMHSKDIAKKANIPHNFLEQILISLKKNNLVKSIRGKNGGYSLAKNADLISVFEILNSLESSIACIETPKDNIILSSFWKESQEKMKEIFSLSLEELLKQNKQNIIFSI